MSMSLVFEWYDANRWAGRCYFNTTWRVISERSLDASFSENLHFSGGGFTFTNLIQSSIAVVGLILSFKYGHAQGEV